jgi:hypothetical protein
LQQEYEMSDDLSVIAFLALRRAFFDDAGRPTDFDLRDKRNTQDDPFDVMVHDILSQAEGDDVTCVRAPGPLISPDMAFVRPAKAKSVGRTGVRDDTTVALAVEVKKLERAANGAVARASGLDYNSTPPCGTVRVYDASGQTVDLPGFYLFVCLEPGQQSGSSRVTAMALCDGNLLNADFKYYIDITGERTKAIGVGSYGDGANRNRPMVIFANPLGAGVLDHAATLVHRRHDLATDDLRQVGAIRRTDVTSSREVVFTCYRSAADAQVNIDTLDPFPMPKRSERTSGRGRFNLGIRFT